MPDIYGKTTLRKDQTQHGSITLDQCANAKTVNSRSMQFVIKKNQFTIRHRELALPLAAFKASGDKGEERLRDKSRNRPASSPNMFTTLITAKNSAHCLVDQNSNGAGTVVSSVLCFSQC